MTRLIVSDREPGTVYESPKSVLIKLLGQSPMVASCIYVDSMRQWWWWWWWGIDLMAKILRFRIISAAYYADND